MSDDIRVRSLSTIIAFFRNWFHCQQQVFWLFKSVSCNKLSRFYFVPLCLLKFFVGWASCPPFLLNLDAEQLSYFLISRIGWRTPSGNLVGIGDISILCMLWTGITTSLSANSRIIGSAVNILCRRVPKVACSPTVPSGAMNWKCCCLPLV